MTTPEEFLKMSEPERRAVLAEECSKLSDAEIASDLIMLFTLAMGRGASRAKLVDDFARVVGDIRAGEVIRQRRAH
jgi:hypothetical protein